MDVKTNIISMISALLALVICGLIYLRMIKREVPEPIGKLQAILPASFFTAFFVAGGVEELFKFLAIIIPMALHTLYDAGTIFNYPAMRGGDFVVGGILGGAAVLTNVVLLIYVLVRAKKNAENFSALSILPKDAQ